MEKENYLSKIYDEEKIKEFSKTIISNYDLQSNLLAEVHFMATLSNQISLDEIEEIKKYNIKNEKIKVFIILCDDQKSIDKWLEENDMPENIILISDYNRDISKSFSILNPELDLPARLSCLLNPWNLKIYWTVMLSISEKRNMEEMSNFSLDLTNSLEYN